MASVGKEYTGADFIYIFINIYCIGTLLYIYIYYYDDRKQIYLWFIFIYFFSIYNKTYLKGICKYIVIDNLLKNIIGYTLMYFILYK